MCASADDSGLQKRNDGAMVTDSPMPRPLTSGVAVVAAGARGIGRAAAVALRVPEWMWPGSIRGSGEPDPRSRAGHRRRPVRDTPTCDVVGWAVDTARRRSAQYCCSGLAVVLMRRASINQLAEERVMHTFIFDPRRWWVAPAVSRNPLVRRIDRVEPLAIMLAIVVSLLVIPVAGA